MKTEEKSEEEFIEKVDEALIILNELKEKGYEELGEIEKRKEIMKLLAVNIRDPFLKALDEFSAMYLGGELSDFNENQETTTAAETEAKEGSAAAKAKEDSAAETIGGNKSKTQKIQSKNKNKNKTQKKH